MHGDASREVYSNSHDLNDEHGARGSKNLEFPSRPTIGKVSMLYGQNPAQSYLRALKSHRIHNERFNYAMFVLEQDAIGGFWNKPMYLLSIIMNELSKPPAERLQWLM